MGERKLIEEYTFDADNVPARVRLWHDKDESVPIYEIETPQVSKGTKAMLDAITEEILDKISISTDIAITDYAVSASGTDTIILKNNLRNTITINDLIVNNVDLASGETLSSGAARTYTGSVAACTAGQTFSYTVSISYQDSITSANYNSTGDGTRLEGVCAS